MGGLKGLAYCGVKDGRKLTTFPLIQCELANLGMLRRQINRCRSGVLCLQPTSNKQGWVMMNDSDMNNTELTDGVIKRSGEAALGFAGIDVSKATLELALTDGGKTIVFENNTSGIRALLAKLKEVGALGAIVLDLNPRRESSLRLVQRCAAAV